VCGLTFLFDVGKKGGKEHFLTHVTHVLIRVHLSLENGTEKQ
jgi:hypothetical protein